MYSAPLEPFTTFVLEFTAGANRLSCVPWAIGHNLVPIQQVSVVRLTEINLPLCDFLDGFH
jgi:hypothetical protein